MAGTPNICVIVPVYNHALTIQSVVRGAKSQFPVIVVDDGSTDQTPAILSEETGITLLSLGTNRGKAEALKAGFARARELGFSHAITIDADGQHPTEALADFAEACRREPECLIVGVRDFVAAGAPSTRRRTNFMSNFWFKFETGQTLADTQCGYRVYPLESIRPIAIHSARYAYELEILVKASWAGIPFRVQPVQADYAAPTSKLSHFRPLRDLIQISCLHFRLAIQAFCHPRLRRR